MVNPSAARFPAMRVFAPAEQLTPELVNEPEAG